MKKIIFVFLSLAIAGCTSMKSREPSQARDGNGNVGSGEVNGKKSFYIISADGTYGLAWGIKDTPLDFDEISKTQNYDLIYDSQKELQNYIVDLNKNKIIYTIPQNSSPDEGDSAIPYAALENFSNGNHNSLGWDTMKLKNGQTLAFLFEGKKWTRGIGRIYLIQGDTVTRVCEDGACLADFGKQMSQAVLKKYGRENAHIFNTYAPSLYFESYDSKRSCMKFTNEVQEPKGDAGITVSGCLSAEINSAKKVSLKLKYLK